MDQDIDPRSLPPEADRSGEEPARDGRNPGERPQEYFSVRLTLSGSAEAFADPRLAGETFFRADPVERPIVTHVNRNTARTMARTEIHGQHETGEPQYFKSLPDSHAPDAAFRAGFLQAMEASVSERLGKVEVSKHGANLAERLDARLKDDLEAFARREPEKAATIWAEQTDTPAPGPTLQAALRAREAEADAQRAVSQIPVTGTPPVIASGDWVMTDQEVALRPVAVVTERGLHAGFEAKTLEGETEVSFSERAFATSREALRHAWAFYEGGDEGLEIAVTRVVAMDRDRADETDRTPLGLVIEHREQPEFPRPETAIYAGADAQLVMTLGRDTEVTRDFAEKLVADPDFRKLVADHIPDAETTLGSGRFFDGEGSSDLLPDELLVVTAYGRDQDAEVLAKFPDEGPLSEALAHHLTTSPVVAYHLNEAREAEAFGEDPAKAISAWVERSSAQIERFPPDQRGNLRAEMEGIAKEAAAAFGLDRQHDLADGAPRSALYSTALTAASLSIGNESLALQTETATRLMASLKEAAVEAGLDGENIAHRLETRAANAREEESWVSSDLAEVAARHGFDMSNDKARSRAAELVDRFFDKATDLVHAAQSAEMTRAQSPLLEALGTMAKLHGHQGVVAFRNEDQARDFAEEMQAHYGAAILKDMASGRTDALARDIFDPAARQAIAAAVVSAAKEHPALGLTAHEAEAAERKLAAEAHRQERPQDQARDRDRALNHDREF